MICKLLMEEGGFGILDFECRMWDVCLLEYFAYLTYELKM